MSDPVRLLLDHFPDLTRLPGSIPELRKLILQRAVRGELTADWRKAHPDTEPASVLLEKIRAEKARLIKAGKIKKQQPLPEIGEGEVLFALPEGWIWTRLGGVITHIVGGGTPSKNNPMYWGGDIPWASVKDLKSKFLEDTVDKITQKGVEDSSTNVVPKGTFLICTRMGLGKISITKIDTAINQDLKAVQLTKNVDNEFFYNFYITQKIQGSGMTVAGIKQLELLSIPFPLPPLAEQQEIVARVERLLGLCDQLEAAQAAEEAVRVRTRRASLAALDGDGSFPAVWRAVHDWFDTLIRTPEDVRELRKTILQLAVRGRLTDDWRRGHPDTEPASVLLEKIRGEKVRLIKAGKIKKEKPLPEIGEDEVPFALPEGWEWCRLGETSELLSGQHIQTTDYNENQEGMPYLTGPVDFGDKYPVITKWTESPKTIAQKNDILITVKGAGVGKLNIVDIDYVCISRQLMALRVIRCKNEAVFLFLLSQQDVINKKSVGIAIPGIGRGTVLEFLYSLPPLAEQQEIVARVERLMGMCDRLEAYLADIRDTGSRVWRALGAG